MRKLIFLITISVAALAAGCDTGDNLYITPDIYTITAEAGETVHTMNVTSSVDWKLSALVNDTGEEAAWISADKIKGRAGDEIEVTLTVRINSTGEDRDATVFLTGDGATARIAVNQGSTPPGTLTAPSSTTFAYADVQFTPFRGTDLGHWLFLVGDDGELGDDPVTGTASVAVFEVNVAEWGTYKYRYGAGKKVAGGFEISSLGDEITVTFTEPTEKATLSIDEENNSATSKRLALSDLQTGVTQYQLFKGDEKLDGKTIGIGTPYTDVNSDGVYTVKAVLSRAGAKTLVYGPPSNEVEVIIPPKD